MYFPLILYLFFKGSKLFLHVKKVLNCVQSSSALILFLALYAFLLSIVSMLLFLLCVLISNWDRLKWH